MQVTLPNDWDPRPHQLPFWQFMVDGGTRAAVVWHRRAGKDSTALNLTSFLAHQRIGTYWHLLPEASQAKRVVWNGIDRFGRRMIDQAFPPSLRSTKREDEMLIEFKCGSMWQAGGSDNYDSLVGTNPIGVVFSEWALADPRAWDYIRPILVENGGWAVFIYTARGRNHGAKMFQMAKQHADWFAEKLTVDDTGLITPEQIEGERQAGMADEMIEQEFYCSFDAPLVGAYYGKLMNQAENDGRIGDVPWEPSLPVQTWWDIGRTDQTAIWFVQLAGRMIHVIDYYENHGVGAEHYAKIIREKPYAYAEPERETGHLLPHDGKIADWSVAGDKTRIEVLRSLGLRCRVVPKLSIEDGRQAVRVILPRCRFDATRCERGIEALRQYRQKWNDEMHTFTAEHVHDWTSHPADAFRTGAVGVRDRFAPAIDTRYRDEQTINDMLTEHMRAAASGHGSRITTG